MKPESETTPEQAFEEFMQGEQEWCWNECGDGTFNGPFDTKEEAIEDAVHGHDVFGNNDTGAFLLDGHSYPNPDYDKAFPQDEENAPELISGKPETFTKSAALAWYLKEIDNLRARLRKEVV